MTFTTWTQDDLFAMDIPEVDYLVDGLIARGAAVLLSGREKSGKGLLAVDLAESIATGEPWLDRAVMDGPVLYCALEESPRVIKARLLRRGAGRHGAPVRLVPLDGTLEQSFQLEDPESLQRLADTIAEYGVVLVIVDTLREAHTGRENDSDDMAPRLSAPRKLAHQLGVTIIFTHHMNKGAGAFRGSTAILASFDDEIAFTREDEENETVIRGSLRFEGRNIPKTVVHAAFNADTARWEVCDAPPVVEVPGLRENVLATLARSAEPMTARDIAEHFPGTALKTIQNRLSKMMQEQPRPMGAIQSPRGRVYFSLQPEMPGTVEPEAEPVHATSPNGYGAEADFDKWTW